MEFKMTVYGVGRTSSVKAFEDQDDCWMLEGLYEKKEDAINAVIDSGRVEFCIVPINMNSMLGDGVFPGIFWPLVETEEDAYKRWFDIFGNLENTKNDANS